MPIAHSLIKVTAAEHAKTVAFYLAALKPLGHEKLANMASGTFVGFGVKTPEWWVAVNQDNTNWKAHVAFSAPDREAVDAFYAAAIAAGGTDNGAPGPRPRIHPNYYAAFVLDPVGNNIEAACILPGEADPAKKI